MARTYVDRLDVNDTRQMDEYNERFCAFVKQFGYDGMNPPEFIPSGQAAEFLGCSKQDVCTMAYREVIRRGPDRGTVSLDDVIAKKVLAPFVERV